jgi:hypothetical protein
VLLARGGGRVSGTAALHTPKAIAAKLSLEGEALLSHPAIGTILVGLATAQQFQDALAAVQKGPLPLARRRDSLPERRRRRLIHPLSNIRRWRAATTHNGKCPADLKRDAAAAWRRFVACTSAYYDCGGLLKLGTLTGEEIFVVCG